MWERADRALRISGFVQKHCLVNLYSAGGCLPSAPGILQDTLRAADLVPVWGHQVLGCLPPSSFSAAFLSRCFCQYRSCWRTPCPQQPE